MDIWVLLEFLPQQVWGRGSWCAGNFATSFAEEKEKEGAGEEGGRGESPALWHLLISWYKYSPWQISATHVMSLNRVGKRCAH